MEKLFCMILLLAASCGIFANNPEEGGFFEGDIELDPDQMAAVQEQDSKRNSFASIKSNIWKTYGRTDTIKYYVNPLIRGAEGAIKLAIADYEKYTCLRFQKHYSRPSGSHLFFTNGTGCSSPVGKMRSGNNIKLARGCWRKGTIIHEIGHSLGFFHEQSRPDRDNFVEILFENIKEANKHNFNKYTTSRIDSRGSPYDVNSIMHYGSKYFSKNGKITIRTKDSALQRKIGQRSSFSEEDKIQLRKMYC